MEFIASQTPLLEMTVPLSSDNATAPPRARGMGQMPQNLWGSYPNLAENSLDLCYNKPA